MQQPNPNGYPQQDQRPFAPPREKRHGRAARIVRGYLMIAGGVATVVGLTLLIVSLFVKIQDWL